MTKEQEFINQISPIIVSEAKSRGYKYPSAIIAQACLESAYGSSTLAIKYHNYFGLKCGGTWGGKSVNMQTWEEYIPGQISNISANFRVYGSMKEGVKGYFDFISYSRYSNLKSANSELDYLYRIKADGYATDTAYVSKCANIISAYGLNSYDITYPKPTKTYRLTEPLMFSEEVKWIQSQLNRHGYRLEVDGYFGELTFNALRDWYERKHIVVDDKIVKELEE